MRPALALPLVALLPLRAPAQTTVTLSVGPVLADQRQGGGAHGFGGSVRAGPLGWVFLDASVVNVPRGSAIVFSPGGGLIPGATTAITAAPVLQLTEGTARMALLYRLGPGVSWLVARPPGAPAVVFGARAGVSLRLWSAESTGMGVLVSADYQRMFPGSVGPRWFLPLTLGLEF